MDLHMLAHTHQDLARQPPTGGANMRRTYEWIVKGGEDVRMDERMERLLGVANGLLARNPGAAAHRLQVCLIRPEAWSGKVSASCCR